MITFDSWHYLAFLAIVVILYWQLNKNKQNWFLLISSIFFYATWDWRFILLIFISTSVDFFAANHIFKSKLKITRLYYLIISISINLIILGFFKYFNFFIETLNQSLQLIGINNSFSTLSIILPIGISFYTFKAISYVVEVYRGEITPSKSFRDYILVVMFFPALIAGPIDLAKDMMNQIKSERKFSYVQFMDGMDLIIWGLVKKIVISNNLSFYVTIIFGSKAELSTLLAICGAIIFGIALFADFSGYTDIARGTARLLGFELKENFRRPYLAQNFSDFWKRWHMSLSSFIKNHIYIPLGGSKCSKPKYIRNIFITWFLTGLWHGAAWNFIFWGIYHGFLITIQRFFSKKSYLAEKSKDNPKQLNKVINAFKISLKIGTTFLLVNIGWLLFITPDMKDFFYYFNLNSIIMSISDVYIVLILSLVLIFYSIPLIVALFWHYLNGKILLSFETRNSLRILTYTLALLLILIFGGLSHDFIYFQF